MKITSLEVLGKLPDPFTFEDGRKVLSVSDWEERRKELIPTVIDMQYGQILPQPEILEIDPLCVPNTAGRMNIWRITTGTKAKPVSYTIYAHKPAGQGPYPIVIDGDLCYGCMQNPEIAKKFTDRGIMLVTFNRCEIVPDIRNPKRTGNLYETYSDLEFGALMAWAWGFSRTLDAVIQLGLADLSCIAFTGLSRGGKTALLAGVLDERATIVNPEGSGCGGSGCYRIHMKAIEENGQERRSEELKDIINAFPDWFSPKLKAYETKEADLPFDQHFLKALLAPRVYFDSQALSDTWAGPVNTWMTAAAAREVWKLYGKEENVLWYWRSGTHAHMPEDFDMLIEIIEHQRHGSALSDKFMKVPFEEPDLIFDWRCPGTV
ncbi:MAG: hypothetical protein IJF78_04730 [Clostridia bacterium]|nr:hypothetical protein [Clostridia bacterium]